MPDYYVSTTASGSGTGTEGSPFTLAQAASTAVANDRVFVKGDGIHSVPTAITPTANFAPTNTSRFVQWIGYTNTITDGGRATLRLSGSATTIWAGSARSGHWLRNLDFDCNAVASSVGVDLNQWNRIENCIVRNWRSIGVQLRAQCTMTRCRVTGGSGGTGAVSILSTCNVLRNEIIGNASPGIVISGGNGNVVIVGNLIIDNTGASSDGINNGAFFGSTIEGNTIDGNGRDGIRMTTNLMGHSVRGNILMRNGAFGLNLSSSTPIEAGYTPNLYGTGSMANTSGACNVTLGSADLTTLTADPFTNKAGGDYSLNSTAGGGAVARQTLTQGYVSTTQTSYADFGAIQAQAGGAATPPPFGTGGLQ